MTSTSVTVAIPTHDRANLLKIALRSALEQDYSSLQVVVLDNASSDDTEAVVESFADTRVRYIRNKKNIGLFRNCNQAIKVNSSPYLCILQDDDVLLPGFVQRSVSALDEHPRAGFSRARSRAIDVEGRPLDVNPKNISDPIPDGIMEGLAFLHGIVAGYKWITQCSQVMMRSSALDSVGAFDYPHSKDTLEINLHYRLAARWDLIFIPEELCEVRYHSARESQLDYDSIYSTGPLAVLAERIDAVSYLMQSPRAADASYRNWLAERLRDLNLRRSYETLRLLPTLNYSWSDRLEIARGDIEALIPSGEKFILVDANEWGSEVTNGRSAMPFLERNGQYWGPPPDDETAIRELERLRQSGATLIVFAWPAFWWLDYYVGLRDHINSHYRQMMNNSRLVVFDLRP